MDLIITEPKKTADSKPADELDSDMSFSFKGEAPRSQRGENVIKDNVEPVVLEINTIPGLTNFSILPKEAVAAGISYSELLTRIINQTLKSYGRS